MAKNITAHEGDNVTLTCNTTSSVGFAPFDGAIPTMKKLSTTTEHTLIKVSKTDEGLYICLNTSETYYLTITGKEFIGHVTDLNLTSNCIYHHTQPKHHKYKLAPPGDPLR